MTHLDSFKLHSNLTLQVNVTLLQHCGHLVIDAQGRCENCLKYMGPDGEEPEDEFLRRTR